MRKKLWVTMTILAISIAGFVLVQYGMIGATKAPLIAGKLEDRSLSLAYYINLYIHIIFSAAALIIGPFTLSKKFREKNLGLHRKMGKVYMLSILCGGVSGYILAFDATGGLPGILGFGTLSILWLTTVIVAFWHIKNKRVASHQRWMVRNYALTFAAVTLRLMVMVLVVFIGGEYFAMGYPIIAWLCWIPNLIFAELYIRRTG